MAARQGPPGGQASAKLVERDQATESFSGAFAGIFHAFGSLGRRAETALESGREGEAVCLLFGQKYDSLPRPWYRTSGQISAPLGHTSVPKSGSTATDRKKAGSERTFSNTGPRRYGSKSTTRSLPSVNDKRTSKRFPNRTTALTRTTRIMLFQPLDPVERQSLTRPFPVCPQLLMVQRPPLPDEAQGWVALDRRARAPRVDWPPLRIVRFSGRALNEGVETHRIEGETVRVYSVPKTIADCFKYRNKVGMDVALEALKDAWTRRRVRMAELDEFARVCRVERVMRPYMEALAA